MNPANNKSEMIPQKEIISPPVVLPQYLVAISACLLVFSGGSAIGWSSPALHMYSQANSSISINPTASEGSWISSLLTIGALFGAIPAGSVSDRIGRKLSLLLLSIPMLLSWGLIIFAESVSTVYIARLIAGVGLGATCTVVPVYITEIAECSVRGTLGSFFQLMICGGILFTYCVGAVTSYQQMAMVCSILPVIFVFAFFSAPESPVYLLKTGREEEAKEALKCLRGSQYNPTKELQALESELNKIAGSHSSLFQSLRRKENTMAVIISLGMMVFQQLSGINIVIFYASKVFESTGSQLDSQYCAILVGLAQLLATFISMVLIERAGRKILLQFSALCMAACLAVLSYYFLLKDGGEDVSSMGLIPIVAVLTYMVVFGVGFGPIPWMISGEVLSEDIKGVGTGAAVSLNWTLAFLVTFVFQSIVDTIGNAGTYSVLAVICVLAFLFSTFVLVETKGKSMQEIQAELAGEKPECQKNGNTV